MSKDNVTRLAFALFGAAAVGVAAWMTLEATNLSAPIKHETADASVDADAGAVSDAAAPSLALEPVRTEELDAGLFLPSLSFDASLPANGPRRIRVGIVLVTFAGAEGAPASARTKAAALTLAQHLADEAKTDFKKAVQGGDPGSDADFGHLERGILSSQPQAEAAVFGLEPGGVSDVVETTRGYWIVKRID